MGNFETNYNSSKHICVMKYAHNTLCSALALSTLLNSFPLNKYHAFFLSNYSSWTLFLHYKRGDRHRMGGDSG